MTLRVITHFFTFRLPPLHRWSDVAGTGLAAGGGKRSGSQPSSGTVAAQARMGWCAAASCGGSEKRVRYGTASAPVDSRELTLSTQGAALECRAWRHAGENTACPRRLPPKCAVFGCHGGGSPGRSVRTLPEGVCAVRLVPVQVVGNNEGTRLVGAAESLFLSVACRLSATAITVAASLGHVAHEGGRQYVLRPAALQAAVERLCRKRHGFTVLLSFGAGALYRS